MNRNDMKRAAMYLDMPCGAPGFGPDSGMAGDPYRRHYRDFVADIFGGGNQPAAPDYTPVAQASEEAARITASQADRVLEESKRQYDRNMEVAKPVVDAQLALMDQSKKQGDEYYNYWKTKAQPVEDSLNAEAMAAGSEQRQNEAVDKAVADSQGSFTRDINQVIRAGKRYGLSPVAMDTATGSMATTQAANTAAAATGAREREKSLGYAKKLDVAGLYRGMPGASQGAYGVATGAGNSAVANSRGVGQDLVGGTATAAGITNQGQQLRINGLGSVLNAQTSAYNNGLAHANDALGGIGSILGSAAAIKTAFFPSSKKLKTDKRATSARKIVHGLQRVPVERWRYKKGEGDGGEHMGPYAEDMHREFGDAAAPGGRQIDLVTMNGLALVGVKDAADRLDKIERKLGMERV
jgi:hypothetical protein